MRQLFCGMLVLIGAHTSADQAPKLSVEISADKDVKFTALAAVLSAVQENQGVEAKVTLRVRTAHGISAQIRVSPQVPYRDLVRLLSGLKKAGVGKITLGVE